MLDDFDDAPKSIELDMNQESECESSECDDCVVPSKTRHKEFTEC